VIPNDAPVADETTLYRRVHPTEIIWSDNDSCLRPNSSVFKDKEMSINLDDVLKDEHRGPESVLDGKPTHSLVSLTAGFVRGEKQEVLRTPKPEDSSHGDVCGDKSGKRKKLFARTARFVILREEALDPGVLAKMRASAATGIATPESP
jgi:hypothetical protein